MARVYNSKNPPLVRLPKPTLPPLSPSSSLSDFLFRRERNQRQKSHSVSSSPLAAVYAETRRGLFRYYGKYRK